MSERDESKVLRLFADGLGLQVNLAGTGASGSLTDLRRARMLADFALRTITPLVFARCNRRDDAKSLRSFPPIFDATYENVRHRAALEFTPAKNPVWLAANTAVLRSTTSDLLPLDFMIASSAKATLSAIRRAQESGIPEDELLELVLDVVADAMVIQ